MTPVLQKPQVVSMRTARSILPETGNVLGIACQNPPAVMAYPMIHKIIAQERVFPQLKVPTYLRK